MAETPSVLLIAIVGHLVSLFVFSLRIRESLSYPSHIFYSPSTETVNDSRGRLATVVFAARRQRRRNAGGCENPQLLMFTAFVRYARLISRSATIHVGKTGGVAVFLISFAA